MYMSAQSCPTLATPWTVQPTRLLHPWDFPGKNKGVGCHFFLQGTFLTQGSNSHLLHHRWILYDSATRKAPRHKLGISLFTEICTIFGFHQLSQICLPAFPIPKASPGSHISFLLSSKVVFDSLQPHGLQHTRLSCPSYLLEFVQTHVH